MADQMDIDPVKAQRVRFPRNSCTLFSPIWVTPAPIAALIRAGGTVFVTASKVTSSRFRPAAAQAAADPLLDPAEIVQHKTAVSVLRAVNE